MAAENGNGNGRLGRLLESALKWLLALVLMGGFALASAAYVKASAAETRAACLETMIQQLQRDVSEVKTDVKDLLRRSGP